MASTYLWSIALAGVAGLAACSCSDADTEPAANDGGAGGATSTVTGTSTGTGQTTGTGTGTGVGGSGGAPPIGPCEGFPGWETYDDHVVGAGYCVPASKDALPEPLVWGPCPAELPFSNGCQEIQPNWPAHPQGAMGGLLSIDTLHEPVLLQLVQNRHDLTQMQTVYELEGQATAAFLSTQGLKNGWGLSASFQGVGLRQGMTLLELHNWGLDGEPRAILGGSAEQLRPPVVHKWQSSQGAGYAVAKDIWTHDLMGFNAAAWGQPSAPVPEVNGQVEMVGFDDQMFLRIDSYPEQFIQVYSKAEGVRTLIGAADNLETNISFGTDGVHMVWIRHSDLDLSGANIWTAATKEFWVAPYTTDPAQLQPTRLTEFPYSDAMSSRMEVGCGYAVFAGIEVHHAQVIRLSDGYFWDLDVSGVPDWRFSFALGATCDEVFFATNLKGQFNVTRIQIDALGAPTPPN